MTFAFRAAVREETPLLLGLVAPSGGGKTFSALRLATGIQSVVGGEIAMIDTEARRALHYAEKFKFIYLEFGQPFGSDRYLEAVQAAVEQGAKTVIVDSMSHEHEGPGGYLEYHDTEVKRLMQPTGQGGGGFSSEFAAQIPAWTRPSARRRKMINGLLQVKANFIFCFRAKEKIKMAKVDGKMKPVELGWQPIAGEEFVYEMTDRFLLRPGSRGVPSWDKEAWDTGVPKMPDDHIDMIPEGRQLDEEMGAALARWARGSAAPARPPRSDRIENMIADFELIASEQGLEAYKAAWKRTSEEDKIAIGKADRDRIGEIGLKHDNKETQ